MTSSISTSKPAIEPGDLESFQKAVEVIDASGLDFDFDTAIKDFDPKKKKRFMRWYVEFLEEKDEAEMAEEAATPKLTREAFATAIHAVDVSDPKTVSELTVKMQPLPYAPSPELIFFGPLNGHKYFFRPGDGVTFINSITSDLKGPEIDTYCLKLQGPNGYHPLLRWVIYLGPLTSIGENFRDMESLRYWETETDLQVFLNIQDKSIWLVAANGGSDSEHGEDSPIDSKTFWADTGLGDKGRAFDLVRICKGPSLINGRLDLLFEVEHDTAEVAGLLVYSMSRDEVRQLKSAGRAAGQNIG